MAIVEGKGEVQNYGKCDIRRKRKCGEREEVRGADKKVYPRHILIFDL